MSGVVKRLASWMAAEAGVELIPSWRAPTLHMERSLRLIFDKFGIDTVIDIGSNVGDYRQFLRANMGFAGPIIGFEPDPELVARLRKRAADTGDSSWTIHETALGAAPDRRRFNRMAETGLNSFLTPLADQPDFNGDYNRVISSFDVSIETLDSFADRLPRDLSRTFVKIDTQGFDLQVLQGGQAVLGQVPALQTELSCSPIYDGSPDLAGSLAAFGAAGFVVSDMILIASQDEVRAVEFDCLMVRRAAVR